MESALSCLERSEKIAIERYKEAKESGTDKEILDHLLREIKKIPVECYKYVISDSDNILTREERYKACKARLDALE